MSEPARDTTTIERRPRLLAAALALAALLALSATVPAVAGGAPDELPWRFAPIDGHGAEPPPPPDLPVQLILDDGSAETAFGVGLPAARQFLWFNSFPIAGSFALEEIWVLFPPGDNVVPGAEVELAVYLDPDGDPTNGAQLLTSFPGTVQVADGNTFSIYPLPAPLTVDPPGELLLGVVNRFVESGVTSETLPAALDTTASQGGSWFAVWPGDPPAVPELTGFDTLLPIDDLQPGNWMIRGFGSDLEPPVFEIPTLGGAGLVLLAVLLLVAGVLYLGRRGGSLLAVLLLAGGTLAGGAGEAGAATTTIDDFTVAQGPLTLTDPADGVGDVAESTVAAGVGGERGIRLELLAVAATAGVTVEVTGGQLTFDADAGARGGALLSWDGTDGDPSTLDTGTGLGGVDLTGGGTESGLLLGVASTSVAGLEVAVEVHSAVDRSSRFALVLPQIAAATDVICAFGDFVDSGSAGGADFTAVTAVTLVVRGGGITAAIDGFATAPPELLAANVTQADTLLDMDADTFGDPGERIRYTVTVENTGALADDLSLEGLLDDANASAVAGSLTTTPLAFRDSYEACGNFSLSVDGVARPGVLANDLDPENGDNTGLTVASMDAATAQGGTVQNVDLAAGTFDYVPPPGFKGIDSFGYVLEDADGNQTPGEVVLLVESLVWFLDDDDDTGPFDGTQTNPFNDLTQAEAASGPGDVLYVVSDDGNLDRLTQGITLKDEQQLIGGGVDLEVCDLTIPAGTTPRIGDATSMPGPLEGERRRAGRGRASRGVVGSPVVTLANNNQIRGLRLDATLISAIEGIGFTDLAVSDVVVDKSSSAEGLFLTLAQGTLTFDTLTVQGTANTTAVNLDSGNADVDFVDSTINPGAGALFYADGDASTVDFAGGTMGLATGSAFPAIELAGNTGVYNFGTLGSIATSDAGIVADNGGTFTVPATTTVTATGGPALMAINGSAFGVDPLVFAGLSSSGTSTSGVDLGNVAQGLTVTGQVSVTSTGAGIVAGTTGTVTMATATNSVTAAGGPALDLANANVSLTFDTLSSSGSPAEGIDIDSVTGSIVVTNAGSSITNGSAAAAVDVDGGSGTFTYPGTITKTGAGPSVRVNNRSSGVHTFSGAVDDDGGGVVLTGNTGATVNFTGGLDVDSGTNTAFTATGGGTVNVTGTNTLTVLAGAPHALDLSGISIGASDMTFASISATGTTAEALDVDGVTNAGTFFGGVVTVNGGMSSGIDVNGSSATFNFTGATVDNTAGAGIALVGANGPVTFGTVDVDGTMGPAVMVMANANAVNLNGGTIGATSDAGASVPAVDVNGGVGNVTVAAAVTNTANRSVRVQGRAGGTVTVSGAVNDTGTGLEVANNTGGASTLSNASKVFNTGASGAVTLTNNAGHTVNLTGGGLDVDTTSGVGFTATGGGTVVVSGAGNTVTTTAAKAVDVDAVTTAATFASVSSTGSGSQGIDLTNLPAASTFAVTGTTTVDNATGISINVDTVGAGGDLDFGATDVLNRGATGIFMNAVQGTADFGVASIPNPGGAGGYGIRVDASSAAVTFAAANVSDTVVGTPGTYGAVRGLPTNDGDGDAIFLKNNTGGFSFTVNGGTIEDIADNAFDIRGSDSTVISGVTIQDGPDGDSFSTVNSAIQWIGGVGLSLLGSTIEDVGDDVNAAPLVADNGMKVADVAGDLTIQNSVFDTATGYVFANATAGSANRVVEIDNRNGADLNVLVTGSTFRNYDFQGLNLRHVGGSLDALVGGPAMADRNVFQNINGAAINTGPAQQSTSSNTHGLLVENNDFDNIGIAVEVFSARGTGLGTHVFVRDNDIDNTISDAIRLAAFAADAGMPLMGSNDPIFRALVTNNTIDGVATQAPGTGGGSAFFVAAEDSADSDVTIDSNPSVTGGAGGGSNAQIGITTQNQRAGDLDLVFTNNPMSNFPGASNAFSLGFFGHDNNASTQTTVRFGGNDWNNILGGFSETVIFDVFTGTMEVEGYMGGSMDSAALVTYLNTVDNNVGGGTFTIFSGAVTNGTATFNAPLLQNPPLTP